VKVTEWMEHGEDALGSDGYAPHGCCAAAPALSSPI